MLERDDKLREKCDYFEKAKFFLRKLSSFGKKDRENFIVMKETIAKFHFHLISHPPPRTFFDTHQHQHRELNIISLPTQHLPQRYKFVPLLCLY